MAGNNLGENLTEGVLGPTAEAAPLPWYLDMASSLPTLSASVGTMGLRGGNTILRGGWGQDRVVQGGVFREAFRTNNPLNLRNWTRHRTQDWLHHKGKIGNRYTPLGFSGSINAMHRGIMGAGEGMGSGVGRAIGERTKLRSALDSRGMGGGQQLITPGFYSRVSAAAKIGWMTDSQFAANRASVGKFLGKGSGAPYAGSRVSAQQRLLMSGGGSLTGYIGGFLAVAGTGQTAARGVINPGTTAQAKTGANLAKRWMTSPVAQGGLGLKAGTQYSMRQMMSATSSAVKTTTGAGAKAMVGLKGGALATAKFAFMATKVLNPLMWAWLAWDVSKLAVKGVGHIVKLGADAYKSYQGGMRTGIMEQGFRDTQATMTSRARGVQAIQNSRLNARSILGNEASSMAAYFG